jgi:hypothetical protein
MYWDFLNITRETEGEKGVKDVLVLINLCGTIFME